MAVAGQIYGAAHIVFIGIHVGINAGSTVFFHA
jgi:hypothetical protein